MLGFGTKKWLSELLSNAKKQGYHCDVENCRSNAENVILVNGGVMYACNFDATWLHTTKTDHLQIVCGQFVRPKHLEQL